MIYFKMCQILNLLIIGNIIRVHCGFLDTNICELCLVDRDSGFTNRRLTSGVLWTETDLYRAECAARCHLFPSIKSFGYSETTRECVAYTIPLSIANNYTEETGFDMYSTCAPVDGGLTSWTSWGPPCTETCGPSLSTMMTRNRSCTNPPPDNGGADCTGDTSETGEFNCGLPTCQVDGQWTPWEAWPPASCVGVCGTESSFTQTRSRSCTDPAPYNGGAPCSGSSSMTKSVYCGERPCPIFDYNMGTCSTAGDCSQANTVCEEGTCVCHMDYFYDSGNCVPSCSGIR